MGSRRRTLKAWLWGAAWAVITVAFCGAVAALAGRLIPGARAHGDYAWINDGNYKAADGSHCCGVADCVEVKPGDIRETGRGAETPFGLVAQRGVYQSRDGKAWVCRRHFRGATPRSSCAFIPGGG